MGLLGSHEFNSLDDLFVEQIEDLYDAEKRLTRALPKMADAAHDPELRSAFQEHLRQTEQQVNRLEQIFNQMDKKPHRETCEAMKGLIKEGEEMIDAKGKDSVRDAALIVAGQRVEHYEMAGYGAARTYANILGHTQAAELLQQTLDEEGDTNKKLTDLALSKIDPKAKVS